MTMLEYAKTILPKVSFAEDLFKKELIKCINWLDGRQQITELKEFCIANFGKQYPNIIKKAFV